MSDLINFQWSIKLNDGQIYMVQAETADELGLAIEEIKSKFLNHNQQVSIPVILPTPKPEIICNVCGGKAEVKEGVSKAGNNYKIMRCLTYPELKTNGGHSFFMK